MSNGFLPDDEADDFLNIRVVRLATKLQRLMLRRVVRDAGLPVLEWRVLFALARRGDDHLRSITDKGVLDPAHTSRAAAQLEAKGLITRRDDPKDQRRRVLSLTPEGVTKVRAIWAEAKCLSQDLKHGFTDAEFSMLKSLLDRASDNADALLADEPTHATQSSAA